jgi:hypothetical protein
MVIVAMSEMSCGILLLVAQPADHAHHNDI